MTRKIHPYFRKYTKIIPVWQPISEKYLPNRCTGGYNSARLIKSRDSYDYCHGNTCDCGDCLNDDQKVELEEARQNLDDTIAYLDRIMDQSPRAEENTINVDSKTTNETAREECEEDGPSHNDPTGETGDPGVVESDITVENESDTTSLDDIIAEVKNF